MVSLKGSQMSNPRIIDHLIVEKSFVPVFEQMLRKRLEFEKLLDHGQLSAFFAPPAYTDLERPPEPSEKPRQPSRIGFR